MDERMSGGSPLDLAQAGEIASFEIAISMFEFPEGGIWGSGVKDIAH